MKISKGIRYRVVRTALYSVYLFLIVFILLEVFLRIYDPFKFRIRANRIILPVNQVVTIKNTINPKLDPIITNTRNSLGFRGPDTAIGFSSQTSIITIGGSTTECHFLNDDKTWTFRLGEYLKQDVANVWTNNAGLDGHSTFGHQVLLNDYILRIKPKIVVFLTGVNDIENDGPSFFDKLNTKNAYPDLLHYLYNNSEVINAVVNISRGVKAQKFNNTTQEWKKPGSLGELAMTRVEMDQRLNHQQEYVEHYGQRLSVLVQTCRQNNIIPIFLTQPCLYGEGRDSITGTNLAKAKVEEGMNGELLAEILRLYNNKMKAVCSAHNTLCIDLAAMMPKNSLYYYDQTHFTNEGADRVAQLLEEKLRDIAGRY